MKSISDIPCKTCITLAVCKGQVSDDNLYADVINNLIPKCSLIEEYTKLTNVLYRGYVTSHPLIEKVVSFFLAYNC